MIRVINFSHAKCLGELCVGRTGRRYLSIQSFRLSVQRTGCEGVERVERVMEVATGARSFVIKKGYRRNNIIIINGGSTGTSHGGASVLVGRCGSNRFKFSQQFC